jgi:hypothetical protein
MRHLGEMALAMFVGMLAYGFALGLMAGGAGSTCGRAAMIAAMFVAVLAGLASYWANAIAAVSVCPLVCLDDSGHGRSDGVRLDAYTTHKRAVATG